MLWANTWSRGRVGRPPLVSGASGRGFEAAVRCFFSFVSAFSRLWWFRFYFVASRLVLGRIAVAVVSHHLVFSFAPGLLLCVGFVFLFRYSCVSYSDRSSKLTTF